MNMVKIMKHHYAVAQILFGSSGQFFPKLLKGIELRDYLVLQTMQKI